jgi:hypothetical protein
MRRHPNPISAPAKQNANSAQAVADKRAEIRAKLQDFYVRGGQLLYTDIPKNVTPSDFQKYVEAVSDWSNNASQWIKENIGDAAQARFLDIGDISIVNWDRAVSPEHNKIINYLTVFRKNISILIESPAWESLEAKPH